MSNEKSFSERVNFDDFLQQFAADPEDQMTPDDCIDEILKRTDALPDDEDARLSEVRRIEILMGKLYINALMHTKPEVEDWISRLELVPEKLTALDHYSRPTAKIISSTREKFQAKLAGELLKEAGKCLDDEQHEWPAPLSSI